MTREETARLKDLSTVADAGLKWMAKAQSLEAELATERTAREKAEKDVFIDDRGTVWTQPTAEAYQKVCRALDVEREERAAIESACEVQRELLVQWRERFDGAENRSSEYAKTVRQLVGKLNRMSKIVDALRADLASAKKDAARLREAAQAVIDRWDSPKWKDLPHTGVCMSRLRIALAALPATTTEATDELTGCADDHLPTEMRGRP